MENHELEIEITKDGKVHVKTKGVKGKACLAYAKLMQEIIGKIQSQDLTAEYYEPDSVVTLDPKIRQQQHRKSK